MPYILNSLLYDTYCDDVGGFSCIVCDIPLCLKCEQNKSQKKCIECKTLSKINGVVCACNSGYYLPNSNQTSCV